jgi:hypothetical protein
MTTFYNQFIDIFENVKNYISLENRITEWDALINNKNNNDDKYNIIFNRLKTKFKLFGGLTAIILIIFLVKMTDFFDKFPPIFFYSFAVICIFFLVGSQVINEEKSKYNTFILLIIFIILTFFVNYLYLYPGLLDFTNKQFIIIFCISILIALALTYRLFLTYLKKQKGLFGFFINLIFYLPCLFNDFIEYIKNQYNITTNTIIILFILEIIIFIYYFYLSKILSSNKKKNNILNEPLYLNKRNIIKDNVINTDGDTEKRNFYSMTFWLYINQNDNSTKEFNIIKYGHESGPDAPLVGKPKITYISNTNTYKFQFSNNTTNIGSINDTIYEFSDVPFQRWNYFVINYYNHNANLYINGVFIKEISLTNRELSVSDTDNIFVGDDNGLDGAICNVNFYYTPLKQKEIIKNYNLFRLNNPPL